MRAYSMDLRERVLRDSDAGMKAAAVAVKYHVSASWVRRLKQRRRSPARCQRLRLSPISASVAAGPRGLAHAQRTSIRMIQPKAIPLVSVRLMPTTRPSARPPNTGVVFSVSAGNSNLNAAGFVPAAYDDAVMTVSATADIANNFAYFSN